MQPGDLVIREWPTTCSPHPGLCTTANTISWVWRGLRCGRSSYPIGSCATLRRSVADEASLRSGHCDELDTATPRRVGTPVPSVKPIATRGRAIEHRTVRAEIYLNSQTWPIIGARSEEHT